MEGRRQSVAKDRTNEETKTRRENEDVSSSLFFAPSPSPSPISLPFFPPRTSRPRDRRLTSPQMQPNQRVRQQTLPRPQHATPPAVRRQTLLIPSSSLHPSPTRQRPRNRRSLHRLYRVSNEGGQGESIGVVGGGRRDEEVRRKMSNRGVLGSVGAPDGGVEVVED